MPMSTSLVCYAKDCGNGGYKLQVWSKEKCSVHGSFKGTENCTCPPPFKLYNFPTEKKDPAKRKRWIKNFNRGRPNDTVKYKEPARGHRVCSEHFVGGAPSVENPDPTLQLGHQETPKPAWHDNTPRAQRTRKRQRVEKSDESEVIEQETQEKSAITMPERMLNALCIIIHILLGLWRKGSEQIGKLKSENEKLKSEIKQLRNEVLRLRVEARKKMSVNLLKSDVDTRFYTGLNSMKCFEQIHKLVSGFVQRRWTGTKNSVRKGRKFLRPPKKFGPQTKLSSADELLLTLMKLRLGLLNTDLARRFKVSASLVSQIFNSWLTALSMTLGSKLVVNYPKEHVKRVLPARFRSIPNLRSIIDCSEIFIETPKDNTLQNMTWSNYKHHNTLKFLVAVAPNSMITFVSKAYGGRNSDKLIVKKSGYLDLLDPHDTLMADKGFNIHTECAMRSIHLYVPPGKRGQNQMSIPACDKTKKIANRRILVEQVIRRMKTFNILKTQLPITLVGSATKMIRVCAALCNLSKPIYKN